MLRDRNHLSELIRGHGFSELEAELLQIARPSIRIVADSVSDESEIPIGASKIGGRPDLPPTMDWIKVDYPRDDNRSLPFIGQLRMDEAKQYDEEALLPEQGILYFFAEPFETRDKDSCRVLYVRDTTQLERKPFPDDIPVNEPMEWGQRYDPCNVTMIPEINLPDSENIRHPPHHLPEGKTWEDFYNLVAAASYRPRRPTHKDTINRLLGNPHDLVSDMQLGCELIANDMSPYMVLDNTKQYEVAKAEWQLLEQQYEAAKAEWQLLLQMDSEVRAGMMWDDAGKICFFIRRADLKRQDFSNVCLMRESG